MKLLCLNQVKMLKSADAGYLSAILNLAPAFSYKGFNSCPKAGKCKATCLAYTGRNRFDMSHEARIRKTKLYRDHPRRFYALLIDDIEALIRKAQREGYMPTVRLNGLSDISWENDDAEDGKNIFELFPKLQFIDYTKIESRILASQPSNYHLTYSVNEKTSKGFVDKVYTDTRHNCAVVFYPKVPTYFGIDGVVRRVFPGDESDLRHLDPRGRLIGLTYKRAFVDDGRAFVPKRSNGFLTIIPEIAH